MTDKNSGLLALPDVEPNLGLNSKGSMVPLTDGNYLTPDKGRIVNEAYRQRMAIVATKVKHGFGIEQIREIDALTVAEFAKTAEFITSVKLQAKGKDQQKYVDEFCHRMTQEAAHHFLAASRSFAAMTGEIMMQSPYPPEVEDKPGFIKRLFGG